MSVSDAIRRREIAEILHFTTHTGLLGILDSRALVSRQRLAANKRLEFILKVNAEYRKDTSWLDYVNLSISRINSNFLSASRKWHPDVYWRVLAFDPVIITHEGVYFSTTNNFYPSAKRGWGEQGIEALFEKEVLGRYATPIRRGNDVPNSWPTCVQAEVLYPGQVSTDYLRRIYVSGHEEQDEVCAQLAAVDHPEVDVIVDLDVFGGAID